MRSLNTHKTRFITSSVLHSRLRVSGSFEKRFQDTFHMWFVSGDLTELSLPLKATYCCPKPPEHPQTRDRQNRGVSDSCLPPRRTKTAKMYTGNNERTNGVK